MTALRGKAGKEVVEGGLAGRGGGAGCRRSMSLGGGQWSRGAGRIREDRGQSAERRGSRERDGKLGRSKHPCGWVIGRERGMLFSGDLESRAVHLVMKVGHFREILLWVEVGLHETQCGGQLGVQCKESWFGLAQ